MIGLEKKPFWVYRAVGADERETALAAYEAGTLNTNWNCSEHFHRNLCPDSELKKAPKPWARSMGWPTPLFHFEKRFMETMFANDENFRLALGKGGVALFVPIDEYVVSAEDVRRWDRKNKNPKNWDYMAREFWTLCKVIDLGVTLMVKDQAFHSSSDFYNDFIYKRYRNLEEGAEIFILGDY